MLRLRFLILAAISVLCLPAALNAKRVPSLEFKDLAGATKSLADLRGSITVVNFWATWCAPCREELPMLTSLNTQFSAKKVRFVAISADENADSRGARAKIDKFMKAHGAGLEVWAGADLGALDRLGLGNELPASIILDENGEVISRVLGEAREQDIRAPLDWLLNGRTGVAPPAVTKHF
jgi:thiol-disulfide isomerase/thioredoxin